MIFQTTLDLSVLGKLSLPFTPSLPFLIVRALEKDKLKDIYGKFILSLNWIVRWWITRVKVRGWRSRDLPKWNSSQFFQSLQNGLIDIKYNIRSPVE